VGVQQRRAAVDVLDQPGPEHGQPAVRVLQRRLLDAELDVHHRAAHRPRVPDLHDVHELALHQAHGALHRRLGHDAPVVLSGAPRPWIIGWTRTGLPPLFPLLSPSLSPLSLSLSSLPLSLLSPSLSPLFYDPPRSRPSFLPLTTTLRQISIPSVYARRCVLPQYRCLCLALASTPTTPPDFPRRP
jgi:hypothetical protein